jgi:hypothetical protein
LAGRGVAPAIGSGGFFDAAESSCAVCASSVGCPAWAVNGATLAAASAAGAGVGAVTVAVAVAGAVAMAGAGAAVVAVAVAAAECAAVRAEL